MVVKYESQCWKRLKVKYEQTDPSEVFGGLVWREIKKVSFGSNALFQEICSFVSIRFLTDHCWTVAKIFRGIELDEIVNREENLPLHIDELRNAIFDVTTHVCGTKCSF